MAAASEPADARRVALFPSGMDERAMLSEGSAVRSLLMDMMTSSELLLFRSCCHGAREMVSECSLRVHGKLECKSPASISALLSALPNAHVACILPTKDWKLADYVAAAQFKAVSLECYEGHVTDGILARLKGKLQRLLLEDTRGAVSDDGLRHVAGTRDIDLRSMARITSAGIRRLAGVRRLCLSMPSGFDCSALAPLAPTLQELQLRGHAMDVSCLPHMPALTVLRTCEESAMQIIRKASAPLRELYLDNANLSGFRLSEIPTLTTLGLQECDGVEDDMFDSPVANIRVWESQYTLASDNVHLFNACTHLAVADSNQGNDLTDGDMHHLTNLQEVDMETLVGVTAVGMRQLIKLRAASLSSYTFNYAGLLSLPALQELHWTSWESLDDPSDGLGMPFQQLAYLALMKPSMKTIRGTGMRVSTECTGRDTTGLQAVFDTIVPPGQRAIRVTCERHGRHGSSSSITFTITREGL